MPVMIYIAVAFVALLSVMLEMHALVEPTRHIERAALTESQPAPAVAPPRASGQALPPYATKAGINPPGAVEKALAPKPEAAPAVICHVEACKAAYRSFTASDCTYQPIGGPRRLCTK